MRALLLSLLLLLPALAGCFSATTDGLRAAESGLAELEVPEGATLVQDPRGAILRFVDVELPFVQNFTVPAGVTLVRAVGHVADAVPVSATMWKEETGRRRCNTDVVDAWNIPVVGVSTCSGLAAIDPPGTKWVARVASALSPLATLDIVFETTPLDGLVSRLDLTQLSMPTHELEETQYLKVPSFDGTLLHVEVTLPKGEGPWPTVIASSPYNGQYNRDLPAMWTYFTHDWAKRGYAIVNADVRGYGWSGGCVEIWSESEQKDQAFLVDWVAQQGWSDGAVGFYGQSYVGTTPVAAAVQAPDALKAIIAVAPVINAYWDWHYGGVPNGENSLSPVAYQVLTDMPPLPPTPNPADPTRYDPTRYDPSFLLDPATVAQNAAKGVCDPTILPRANDPRAIYDAFYEERNFSARAKDVKAAVLYTQGFEDLNVKSAMIPGWFNEITAPKLGLFGHWVHQHPTRADEEILFLGWMDQYVKGKPLGLDRAPTVEVVVDNDTFRTATEWPPANPWVVALQADLASGTLAPEASGPAVDLVLAPLGKATPLPNLPIPGERRVLVTLEHDLTRDLALAGVARLAVTGTLQGLTNAYFYGALYDVGPEGSALVSYGMFNLAHRNGHDRYEPATPGQKTTFELPFLPTEYVFREGHTLRIELSGGATEGETPSMPGTYTLASGEATQLLLPTVNIAAYEPAPATATP